MPAATVDTIGVDVVANMQAVDTQMTAVERRVDRGAQRIDKSLTKAFGFGALFKGFAVLGVLRGLESGLQTFAATRADPTADIGDAWAAAGKAALNSVPVISQIYGIEQSIYDIVTGRLEKERAVTQELEMQQRALDTQKRRIDQITDFRKELTGEMDKAALDAIGTNNVQGIELRAKQAREALEREVEHLQSQARALLQGTDKAGPRGQALKDIEEFRQNRERAIERERREALKSLKTGPEFDVFSTVLGQFKAKIPSGPTPRPASEDTAKDTAKNTRETVAVLNKIYQKSGGITAYA